MEPLNDEELSRILRQWQAPATPSSLEAKVLGALPKQPWWRWLLTGSVRIPVPAAIVVAILTVWMLSQPSRTAKQSSEEVNFANFQPVKELKPRIIRSTYVAE